jgi:hypothetical protein
MCNEDANQWEFKDDTMIFYPDVHVLANMLVPIVSIAHLVVRRLTGITRQARTSGTARTYPKSEGSSMTRSTRVAFRGSRGASIMPLTKHFSGAPHKLLASFDGDHHQAVLGCGNLQE